VSHSAEVFRAFFEISADSIFVIDAATDRVVDANARAAAVTGRSLTEILGAPVERVFHSCGDLFAHPFDPSARRVDLEIATNTGHRPVSARVASISSASSRLLFVSISEDPTASNAPASQQPDDAWPARDDFPSIIGRGESIHRVCRLIGSVAKSETTVLIQGESGTGKEIVANAIHAHSRRHRGPFVKVNCAALTETLLESELFGHVRGAFTGAIRDRRGRFKQADGGTILLDEIGSMPLAGQAALLRVLQERELEPVGSSVTVPVDVRVIAATNGDLSKAVADGAFRADLYYRINVFGVVLPPLRERPEDIPLLSEHFLRRYNSSAGKRIRSIAPGTIRALLRYDWPGNVRELENAIEHAVIVETGSVLLPGSLPMNLAAATAEPPKETSTDLGLREQLTLVERQILVDTLLRANGIRKRAAEMLGIDSRNMPYFLRKHRLTAAARS